MEPPFSCRPGIIPPKGAKIRRTNHRILLFAAASLLLAAWSLVSAAEKDAANPVAVRPSVKIPVSGIQINTVEMGSGLPLLLLHGLGGSWEDWSPVLDFLSSHFQVIAIDFPGFGESDAPQVEYSIPWLSDIVAKFLRERNLERVRVAGHSMGALVALNLAAQENSPVEKLVVVDAVGAGDKAAFLSHVMTRKIIRPDSRWNFMEGPLRDEFTGMVADALSRQKSRTAREFFESMPRVPFTGRSLVPMTPAVQLSAAIMDFNLEPKLASIRQPTLILWGKNDPIAPPHDAEFLQQRIPHAALKFMECGHSPMQEHPAEFTREITGFLQMPESDTSR